MKAIYKKNMVFFSLLTLPGLLGFLILYIIPFLISFYFALVDNNVSRSFVGLQNFIETINNQAFRLAIKNTVLMLALYVPINMVLPLLMAIFVEVLPGRAKAFYTFCFMLPLIIPSAAMTFFWKALFGINGIINGAFFSSNPADWLNTDYARFIIILMLTWKNAGYNMILYLSGLQFIPKEYYEFASIEGAGSWAKLRRITLPSLRPTLFFVLVMTIINSFGSFKEIFLLSGSYPHQSIYMLQHYMNNQFSNLNYQKLASASYILSVAFVIISLVIFRKQNKKYV